MATSFLQGMRMNSLFPANNSLNTAPPLTDPVQQYQNEILPLIHGEEDRRLGINQRLMNQMRAQQQQDAANAKANPNVVLKPDDISPLDKAKLLQSQEKINTTQALGAGKIQTAQEKEMIDSQNRAARTAIADFKSKNPGMKFDFNHPGGNVIAFDPISGSYKDTGIPSGHVSDADKLAYQRGTDIQKIDETGNQNRQTLGVKQAGDVSLESVKQGNRVQLKTTAPGVNNKSILPTQQRADYYNKAKQLYDTHPELQQFIHLDQNNKDFSIDAPGKSFIGSPTGPDSDTFHSINSNIYGSASPSSSGGGTDNDPLGIRQNLQSDDSSQDDSQ